MNSFMMFVFKEFIQIFRDKRTLSVILLFPIVQLLLFGFALKNELRNAKIAVLDHAHDEISEKIISKLNSTAYFTITEYLQSEREIQEVMKKGIIKEVIVFPSHFSQSLVKENRASLQLIIDASDPNMGSMIKFYTESIIENFRLNYFSKGKISSPLEISVKMVYNPELKSVFMFVPGILAMILMILSALMTSISISREKELGTMEVLLVSPLNPLEIIIGKVIPYLLISFFNAAIIIIFSVNIFGMPILGSITALFAVTFIFILTSLSLGIFISNLTSSQQAAMMLAMVGLLLPTTLLSGFVFPIENMPNYLQVLSNIIPAKWYVLTLRNIMLKGAGFEYYYKDALILLLMSFVFIVISVKKFKLRLE